MGNWQMEVGRMMSYILFPIGVYYYFNQTENIEEWIKTEKKKFQNSDNIQHTEFMNFIEEFNKKQQLKKIVEMEAQYNEMK